MSPTPPLKSSGLPRYNNLGQISWCWKIKFLKISNLLRFENGFENKNTPPLKSSWLPRYNNLGQISWCWKINIFKNFKFAPIRKRFRDSLDHFASKNVPHTTSQILRVTEIQQLGQISWCWKINIFKNFKFAPIRKRFRDSGSASFCEQKCPPKILRVTEIQRIWSNQLMLKNRYF